MTANERVPQTRVSVKIGIWNGARTVKGGQLLYQRLLTDAVTLGMGGGTVWAQVEGSQRRRVWRTVQSEIGSNELPLWMEFLEAGTALTPFLETARARVGDQGVIVCETVQVWNMPALRGEARGRQEGDRLSTMSRQAAKAGVQLQIYTLEGSKVAGKPVYQAAAEYLRAKEVMWISTSRGMAGFGAERRIHRPGWFVRREDIPIILTAVDVKERLEPHIPELISLLGDQAVVSTRAVDWVHP
ncbi:DUF190 domain-containing protein [Alicyclobacillus cycloheptanicus]|uniref:DUF190 domain-containing protein n=1 Tax=Alicyclobacillus cycloheptanicus TaxID=1457 RepID=UPI002379A67C|nr:DUF190 domain-containing protein [Alicyclobacillus cycloheptanicus]